MPEGLLARAREQAERSDPSVRAAALLRIARIETKSDQDKARNTFQQAPEAARRLSNRDGESLVDEARFRAAAVAPDLLSQIPASRGIHEYLTSSNLCQIMLNHGHVDEAISYLIGRLRTALRISILCDSGGDATGGRRNRPACGAPRCHRRLAHKAR